MKELVEAANKMNKVLHECEDNGENVDTTLNELSKIKVHGVVFPTLMLLEIIGKFAEGAAKRQEARFEENKKQQPVTKQSKLLDILQRGADYGKKALGPLSIASVGYEALTAKDAQAALSDFINDAMFINPITAGVATALTSSEAGRGSELSDKDYDRMIAESFEYEKDPDRYVGPIEEDTYIEEKPRPTGRLPKSGSPTFMSVE